jgi:hypothetical protein
MAAECQENPGLIENSPHLRCQLFGHVLPMLLAFGIFGLVLAPLG